MFDDFVPMVPCRRNTVVPSYGNLAWRDPTRFPKTNPMHKIIFDNMERTIVFGHSRADYKYPAWMYDYFRAETFCADLLPILLDYDTRHEYVMRDCSNPECVVVYTHLMEFRFFRWGILRISRQGSPMHSMDAYETLLFPYFLKSVRIAQYKEMLAVGEQMNMPEDMWEHMSYEFLGCF